MRVFLSGFMAAGKSTVAMELARQLEVECVDLDTAIEAREGATIAEIFADLGEAAFRDLESAELSRVLALDPVVVALGGGTMMRSENRDLITDRGTLVWLDTPRSTILSRLGKAEAARPLVADPEQMLQLLDQRLAVYRQCDLRVRPAENDSPAQIATHIRNRLIP